MSGLAREAGWRTTAATIKPSNLVEEEKQSLRRRRLYGAILLGGLPVVVAELFHPILPTAITLGTFLAMVGAVIALYTEKDLFRAAERSSWAEEFEDGPGLLVYMIVLQGAAPTGEDVGRLWFEEGRLYFSGRRTSFGITPSQVRRISRARERLMGVRNEVDVVLCKETLVGPMAVSIASVMPPNRFAWSRRARLRADLVAWAAGAVEGEGQFPPAALGPSVVSQRRLLVEATAITLSCSSIYSLAVGLCFPNSASYATATFLLAVLAFVFVVPASSFRWRALRDRRRLRR